MSGDWYHVPFSPPFSPPVPRFLIRLSRNLDSYGGMGIGVSEIDLKIAPKPVLGEDDSHRMGW